MTATSEALRICGGVEVPNRDEDDPPYYAVVHRDIGGPQLRGKHALHDPNCWCAPLLMGPEDGRRAVNRAQFDSLERLN